MSFPAEDLGYCGTCGLLYSMGDPLIDAEDPLGDPILAHAVCPTPPVTATFPPLP